MQSDTKKIAVISLGCDKNRVDTERMLSYLSRGNYVITTENEAQIIIINTCAFIESARKEAVDTILQCAEYKKNNCQKLIVTGCLPQKYLKELQADLPEVDAFLGVNEYERIGEIAEISSASLNPSAPLISSKTSDSSAASALTANHSAANINNFEPRVLTTPAHYAYLKIADGCDNHCTYCTIPSIRGAYRSNPIEVLVAEAKQLAQSGVKELILVAQDVTNYGQDLYQKRRLVDLIKALSQTDIQWIRLMYCYPQLIDLKLIEEIKCNPKVVKYLDIPLQHIDDKILRLMGRKDKSGDIINLINNLRKNIPDIALRTTFITGFPTESDFEFDNLLNFVKEYKLTHVGIFAYSAEPDTPSYKLNPKVSKRDAVKRQRTLAAAQQGIVAEFNRGYIGKTVKVLCDGIDFKKQLFHGRTYFSAPDVDTLVYFKSNFAASGEFYDIRITGVKGYDLVGERV